MQTIGLLLAAGRGSRFDASGTQNKLLATLPNGLTVAQQSARNLRRAVKTVIAIIKPNDTALRNNLQAEGCTVLECVDAHQGMGASLACGAAALVQLSQALPIRHALVVLADMPCIADASYAAVLQAMAQHAVVVPRYQNQRGHPVGFAHEHFPALAQATGDVGARAIFATQPVHYLDLNDVGIVFDIDRTEDLQAIL